ncbi:MAG: tRNA adenosine(34) deaminase TadA [Brachymonas sp.]|nr:tRNA adenosine(34) deaminase TadA [Brachymonas sp.]MDO4795248.1 tRNA adenosine(34) deaminase TadA [Brachymonas sp.]
MPANASALFDDAHYLQLALAQAQLAAQAGEVPVGAVVVSATGQVLGQGHNRTLSDHDPSAHAEIQALRAAAQTTTNHRLEGCTLYVTLEPCAMCSGALLHARLARVVYAVADPKTGAAGSVLNLFAHSALNHQTVCLPFAPQDAAGTALREQCAAILQTFFQARRQAQTALRQQPLHAPLREDALRPPPQHFDHIAPLQALQRWSQFVLLRDPDQPAGPPWRMHVWDTAPHDTTRPAILLLHGYASYGLLWAELIAPLHAAGWRVLAPDLLGHGQSDKPKKVQCHSLKWHAALLQQWLAQAHFDRHHHRAAVLHDSAIGLLNAWPEPAAAHASKQAAHTNRSNSAPVPEQTSGCSTPISFTHALALLPDADAAHTTPWREACRLRPRFDLDAHWALGPAEAAGRYWSTPWPDAGHRAALQWPQWAQAMQEAQGPAMPADDLAWRQSPSANASVHHTRTAAEPPAPDDGAHGTIAAAAGVVQPPARMQTFTVPSGGAAFRHWLQQHGNDLIQQLQAHRPGPQAPSTSASKQTLPLP